MESRISLTKHNSPIIAAAIHDGHYIPQQLLDNIKLKEHERMREEDPYTAYVAHLPVNTVVIGNSRFIIDLNRPREKSIYKTPEDAWGLAVWKTPIPLKHEKRLLAYYDLFYKQMKQLIEEVIANHGGFVILDMHSYNHKRATPHTEAPAIENPEINVGTQYNSSKWHPLIQAFIDFLSQTTIKDHEPDVRENIKFKGGAFANWVAEHYGAYGCVLSIEFKKTFMDEWTGRVDIDHINDIQEAIQSSLPLLKKELKKAISAS
ncbi:N-formylglutamate amidohydrolase [Olivibacter sp. SDN3]|uniref:N-formylglutamate amidohydrolase n=1 Tax=Olivibacter sp. SDN3 TaxID=2764720 RepID=UPI00165174BE|nr:N-formylglutamate amidohydrolase [Olivibacter sp. SDN3]QNL49623.1 N-formylglutamate amidohydrolase [Olivibacter sp. SDN3]